MTKVTNIDTQTLSLGSYKILPGDSHTWLSTELTLSLSRKIWRLRGMGLIQVEESPDILSDISTNTEPIIEEVRVEEIETNEEIIEEKVEKVKETPKPKKKNTRKKSQSKGE